MIPAAHVQDRYLTLDAMRGIAALAVVLYHFDFALVPRGYLAVDFFFLLSGFVLTRTYAKRLAGSGTFVDFARIRAIRLMPVHMIGVLSGAGWLLLGELHHWQDAMGLPAFGVSLLFNLALLPTHFNDQMFPMNGPAWTLLMEMLASLGLPALLKLRSSTLILTLCAIVGLALAFIAYRVIDVPKVYGQPFAFGAGWYLWYIGFLRMAFSFPLGVAIALLTNGQPRRSSHWVMLLPAGLTMVFLPPLLGIAHIAYVMTCIVVVFPGMLIIGSRFEPTGFLANLASFAGLISYPLYAVHSTLALLSWYFLGRRFGLSEAMIGPIYLAASIGLAWLIAARLDPAIRGWLSKRFPPTGAFRRPSSRQPSPA
jgi:peptidoglycan/LPS O-acetylase OafA/YrhL